MQPDKHPFLELCASPVCLSLYHLSHSSYPFWKNLFPLSCTLFVMCDMMWNAVANHFPQSGASLSHLFSPTEQAVLNMSKRLPSPSACLGTVWFIFFNHHEEQRRSHDQKKAFSTIRISSQENKLTSITRPFFSFCLSQNFFLIMYCPVVEWKALTWENMSVWSKSNITALKTPLICILPQLCYPAWDKKYRDCCTDVILRCFVSGNKSSLLTFTIAQKMKCSWKIKRSEKNTSKKFICWLQLYLLHALHWTICWALSDLSRNFIEPQKMNHKIVYPQVFFSISFYLNANMFYMYLLQFL